MLGAGQLHWLPSREIYNLYSGYMDELTYGNPNAVEFQVDFQASRLIGMPSTRRMCFVIKDITDV